MVMGYHEMPFLHFLMHCTLRWMVTVSGFHLPVSCEVEMETIGKIIHHAYVQYDVFPLGICKSSLRHHLFGQVEETALINSFLHFVTPQEANMIKSFGTTLTDPQPIMDILCEYFIFANPTKENVMSLIAQAANVALIRLPWFYHAKPYQRYGVCSGQNYHLIWFESLYASIQPTPENVIKAIHPDESNAQDQRITTWLHRYIRYCSVEQLRRFLRFVTGSSCITPNLAIQVQYCNQPQSYLRPLVKTCFKILFLPRQYSSFTQLRENLNFNVGHLENWAVHDGDGNI